MCLMTQTRGQPWLRELGAERCSWGFFPFSERPAQPRVPKVPGLVPKALGYLGDCPMEPKVIQAGVVNGERLACGAHGTTTCCRLAEAWECGPKAPQPGRLI